MLPSILLLITSQPSSDELTIKWNTTVQTILMARGGFARALISPISFLSTFSRATLAAARAGSALATASAASAAILLISTAAIESSSSVFLATAACSLTSAD